MTIVNSCGLFGISHLGDYCALKFFIIGYMESVEGEIFRSKYSKVDMTIVIFCPLKDDLNKRVTEIVIHESVNFLSTSICVERIVQSVIINQKFLYIPKSYRLLEFVKSVLKIMLGYVLNIHDPHLKQNCLRKPA